MIPVLFFLNEDHANNPLITTMEFANYLSSDPRFSVKLETKRNIELVDWAKIIFNRHMPEENQEFLEVYDSLKKTHPDKLYINSPLAIASDSKSNLLQFINKGIMVDSLISDNPSALSLFAQEYNKVVVKPLDGYAGKGISLVPTPGRSLTELEDIFYGQTQGGSQEVLVQRFIDEISTLGDKRVNVLFYEPISAALRLPKEGSFLAHTTRGGRTFPVEISNRDREIIDVIRPYLKEIEAPWAGVDIIGPYLSEINLSCPGFCHADRLNKNNRTKDYLVTKLLEYSVEK